MTSPECVNGTERCADAISQIGDVADVIVNLQGDAPLLPHFVVKMLVERLAEDTTAAMATPAVPCSRSTYEHLLGDRVAGRVGGTTVVFSGDHRALYFSKEVIPFVPSAIAGNSPLPVFLHLGLYAYRRTALDRYRRSSQSQLEQLEGLEQLRFLELGMPVSVVAIEPLKWDPIELNNPGDVPVIESVLRDRGID